MSLPPPMYDQVRESSARGRARERARAGLGHPSYASAARFGALAGVALAVVGLLDRLLPNLVPAPPLSVRGAFVRLLVGVAVNATLFVCVAALVRAVRWSYVRVRFGGRALQ